MKRSSLQAHWNYLHKTIPSPSEHALEPFQKFRSIHDSRLKTSNKWVRTALLFTFSFTYLSVNSLIVFRNLSEFLFFQTQDYVPCLERECVENPSNCQMFKNLNNWKKYLQKLAENNEIQRNRPGDGDDEIENTLV
jgi:hypothetical protein